MFDLKKKILQRDRKNIHNATAGRERGGGGGGEGWRRSENINRRNRSRSIFMNYTFLNETSLSSMNILTIIIVLPRNRLYKCEHWQLTQWQRPSVCLKATQVSREKQKQNNNNNKQQQQSFNIFWQLVEIYKSHDQFQTKFITIHKHMCWK